jgi:hypothetical protein
MLNFYSHLHKYQIIYVSFQVHYIVVIYKVHVLNHIRPLLSRVGIMGHLKRNQWQKGAKVTDSVDEEAGTTFNHGCQNGRPTVKFTVRTTFSSGRPRTSSGRPHESAITPQTDFTVRAGINPSVRTHSFLPSPVPSPPPPADAVCYLRGRGRIRKIKIK